MRYYECILNTPADEIDSRCDELTVLGVGGFVIENEEDFQAFLENNHQYWDYVDSDLEARFAGISRVKFYLTEDEDGASVLAAVRARYPELAVGTVVDSDWENNWREYYKPIETGKRLVIVPEWEEIPAGERLPLRLDPGLIFGTGSHATTRMCLEALEDYAAEGKKVLDLGCGSGILGIGALVLGCESCLGVDVDPKAPDVAAENAGLNSFGPDRIRFLAGDLIADASLRASLGSGYDIVLANIVADVIVPLSPHVPGFLKPGGIYISSGIIDGRQDEVRHAIEGSGFTVLAEHVEEEWHCFVARLN
ncbi:MAG: 50S ribosomal protein L11 methyltransferase [Oscillospiraceae bacterium]|nr:50S ribosomal protein L11 methyltransferase [Oscillospiraceae bacterium]